MFATKGQHSIRTKSDRVDGRSPVDPNEKLKSLDIPAFFGTVYALLILLKMEGLPAAIPLAVSLMILPGIFISRRANPPVYRKVWNGASGIFIVAMVAANLFFNYSSQLALVAICMFLMLHKWFNPRGTREHLEIWGLSALVFLVGGLNVEGLIGYFLLIGWGIATCQLFNLVVVLKKLPGTSQPRQDSPYTLAPHSLKGLWGLAPLMLLTALLIYFISPRVRPHGLTEAEVYTSTPQVRSIVRAGFSQTVNMRSMTTIKETDGIAFRVIDPPAYLDTAQVRFRMATLNEFDGWEWTREIPDESTIPMKKSPTGEFFIPRVKTNQKTQPNINPTNEWYLIRMIELQGPIIPLPESAASLRGIPEDLQLALEDDGRIDFLKGRPPREFQVLANPYQRQSTEMPLLRGEVLPVHTEIPEALRPATARAADIIIPDSITSDLEKTRTVVSYLKRNGLYTKDLSHLDEGPDGLIHFMNYGMAGHCELFATSMALILRNEGIPTRLVTGFQAGEMGPGIFNSEKDDLIVYHRNAHAWVEVWFPDRGWLAYDPTPATVLTAQSGGDFSTSIPGIFGAQLGAIRTFFEGYDYYAQKKILSTAREKTRSTLADIDHGSLLRAQKRLATNLREPGIQWLIIGLLALNVTAWVLYFYILKVPTRTRRSKLPAKRRLGKKELLHDILHSLGCTDWSEVETRSPRESIIDAAALKGLDKGLAEKIACLYNTWRYSEKTKPVEREIRECLREVRQAG